MFRGKEAMTSSDPSKQKKQKGKKMSTRVILPVMKPGHVKGLAGALTNCIPIDEMLGAVAQAWIDEPSVLSRAMKETLSYENYLRLVGIPSKEEIAERWKKFYELLGIRINILPDHIPNRIPNFSEVVVVHRTVQSASFLMTLFIKANDRLKMKIMKSLGRAQSDAGIGYSMGEFSEIGEIVPYEVYESFEKGAPFYVALVENYGHEKIRSFGVEQKKKGTEEFVSYPHPDSNNSLSFVEALLLWFYWVQYMDTRTFANTHHPDFLKRSFMCCASTVGSRDPEKKYLINHPIFGFTFHDDMVALKLGSDSNTIEVTPRKILYTLSEEGRKVA